MKQNIMWIDIETTGIDENEENILEVAVIPTDYKLEQLDDGVSFTVGYSPNKVEDMKSRSVSAVQEMHSKNGLWLDLLLLENDPLWMVDINVAAYIKKFTIPYLDKPIMGGNSIRLDANFIFRQMPITSQTLHYRLYDMTSVAYFMHNTNNLPFYPKSKGHRAFGDIKESLAEAQYLAKNLQAP